MINFKTILRYASKLENNIDELFNTQIKNENKVTVFEDEDVSVTLTLSYQQTSSHARWIYPTIIFKNYNIKKDGNSIKIENDLQLSENFSNTTLRDVVESCLNTCNISNIECVNFSQNGYSLEVLKTSSKYITISEHINAVRFEKRFDSLDYLFNYINYRKELHKSVTIGVNVPDAELSQINRAIKVLENNTNNLLVNIIDDVTPIRKSLVDMDNIKLEYKKKVGKWTHFELSYIESDIKLYCMYNPLSGITMDDIKLDWNKEDAEILSILLEMVVELERSCSGLLSRFFSLVEQKKKHEYKITTTTNKKSKVKQLKPYDVTKDLYKAFCDALANTNMKSASIPLTPFGGYKRYLMLDGVMKNRKRCDLIVVAKNATKNSFVEYSIQVEKNRMTEEVTNFLNSYFV